MFWRWMRAKLGWSKQVAPALVSVRDFSGCAALPDGHYDYAVVWARLLCCHRRRYWEDQAQPLLDRAQAALKCMCDPDRQNDLLPLDRFLLSEVRPPALRDPFLGCCASWRQPMYSGTMQLS